MSPARETLPRRQLAVRLGVALARFWGVAVHAVVESFFGTLKTELVYRHSWLTRREARLAIHEYVEVFYNRRRRHSHLGYLSPAEFENQYLAARAA